LPFSAFSNGIGFGCLKTGFDKMHRRLRCGKLRE
jgi:hypothetical protein